MATIQDYLSKIKTAVYGKDVRQSIYDAIHQCYEDGRSGSIDLIAREQILKKADTVYVDDEVAKAKVVISQGSPLFAKDIDWLESNGNTTKVYVLDNGNLAWYRNDQSLEKVNQYDPSTAKYNMRVSLSSGMSENKGWVLIEVNNISFADRTDYIVRFNVALVNDENMGAYGNVGFIDSAGAVISMSYILASHIHEDEEGYYLNLMEMYTGTDCVTCYLALGITDRTNITSADCVDLFVEFRPLSKLIDGWQWVDTGTPYANYILSEIDKEEIAKKVLDMLNVSYISPDSIINVGTYTLRYDDVDNSEIIGEVTT